MSKIKYEHTYNLARILGGNAFKLIYRPIVLNAEVIPDSGPIVICCNHEHKFDQYPIVCSTKRYIRWVAKKEYESNPFYRLTGCIFVERPVLNADGSFSKGDNSQANKDVLKTLYNGGAIGIFPEGTRNRLLIARRNIRQIDEMLINIKTMFPNSDDMYDKLSVLKKSALKDLEKAKEDLVSRNIQEPNGESLLPFKPGAVRYARDAKALIVPAAVTGIVENQYLKEYHSKQRIIVSFGNPFKVDNLDDNEALKLLNESIVEQKEYHQKVRSLIKK